MLSGYEVQAFLQWFMRHVHLWSAISAACKAGGTGGMFDDDIYETLKNEMAHSKDGVYDNLPGGEALWSWFARWMGRHQ